MFKRSLNKLILESNDFYRDLLGYKPEKTSLKQIPNSEWLNFTQARGLNSDSSGVFMPRNQTAIIRGQNPLNLFHEYFGHGLYCEQSLQGRELINLEMRLMEEEKRYFDNRKFTLKEIKNFREENKIFQELDRFRRQNLGTYEGFAVFTEFLLSGEFGLRDMFERKYESQKGVNELVSFNQQWGDLATFYGFGLKKVQDKKRILNLSKDIFGKRLERIPLILHFGSGKPFSDIDLFAVSNDIGSFYSEWIDIRAYSPDFIEEKIKVLDPMVTDPVMIGDFVFGNQDYLKKLKYRVIAQPITKKAIDYNLEKWKYYDKRGSNFSLSENLRNKNLRSSRTYLTNALAQLPRC